MKDFGSVLTMFTTVSSDLFRNISEKITKTAIPENT